MKTPRHNAASISQADLDQITDYIHSISFANEDFIKKAGRLYEGLTTPYDLQKVKDVVCWEFKLLPQQFHIEERTDNGAVISIAVFVLSKGVSRNQIGEIKHRMGTFVFFVRAVKKSNRGVVLVFESRLQYEKHEEQKRCH